MKCKHCGLGITERSGVWVHTEGPQERKRTCAINPYGYDAAPDGEPCVDHCNGHREA